MGRLRWETGRRTTSMGKDLYKVKQLQDGKWVVVWPREFAAPGAKLISAEAPALPSFTLLGQSVLVGRLHRRALRAARPRPDARLGHAAPDQPGALRAGVPRRLSHLPAVRRRVRPAAHARAHRAGVLRLRRGAALAARALQGQSAQHAARHLRLHGDDREPDPVDLDRRLPPHGVALRRASSGRWASCTFRCPSCSRWLVALAPRLCACGRCCATPTSARRCARPPRTRRWRRPSASTRSCFRCCCRACAPRSPRSPASASRSATPSRPAQIYAWIGVVFAVVMIGGLGNPLGPLVAGPGHRRERGAHHGAHRAGLGAAGLVLAADRRAAAAAGQVLKPLPASSPSAPRSRRCRSSGCRRSTSRSSTSSSTGSCSPRRGTSSAATRATSPSATPPSSAPASTRTAVLAGKLGWPFLATLPARGRGAGAARRGARARWCSACARCAASCSRCSRWRVTFVFATIVLNTPIDGGPGVYMSGGAGPEARAVAVGHASTCWRSPSRSSPSGIAYAVYHSRFGTGLFAIHDDEDVAEVMGVPTYRFKLAAFALSCAPRRPRRRHPRRVRLLCDGGRDLLRLGSRST